MSPGILRLSSRWHICHQWPLDSRHTQPTGWKLSFSRGGTSGRQKTPALRYTLSTQHSGSELSTCFRPHNQHTGGCALNLVLIPEMNAVFAWHDMGTVSPILLSSCDNEQFLLFPTLWLTSRLPWAHDRTSVCQSSPTLHPSMWHHSHSVRGFTNKTKPTNQTNKQTKKPNPHLILLKHWRQAMESEAQRQ